MSEKRFVAEQVDVVNEDETEVWDVVFDTENTYAFMVRDTDTASDLCDLLNEQQATIKVYEEGLTMKIKKINEQKALITNLQGDVNRLQYIIDELKKDNYKRFEKINELKAKLREKEEDEQLYANEIVKLNKEAKEVLDFKNLGGDY